MSQKIGIVGSGLIGRSWAMLFAASEFSVAIYDVIHENVDTALVDIQAQLNNLESKGLLRGKINDISSRRYQLGTSRWLTINDPFS
ncbi:unnamed protein product [Oppiella nova]|uniref:3-hydroxyacyl-CoA dehydrogenase NAD binding domain-containing protein n=1 Tax=Oppiella nova TaxID=334625 RepID=A0A7R9MB29_9ACAR|nr:unnamed protein product [Oppiella nova]CAG2173930.1 unnamed protein product [Oppiella nova]